MRRTPSRSPRPPRSPAPSGTPAAATSSACSAAPPASATRPPPSNVCPECLSDQWEWALTGRPRHGLLVRRLPPRLPSRLPRRSALSRRHHRARRGPALPLQRRRLLRRRHPRRHARRSRLRRRHRRLHPAQVPTHARNSCRAIPVEHGAAWLARQPTRFPTCAWPAPRRSQPNTEPFLHLRSGGRPNKRPAPRHPCGGVDPTSGPALQHPCGGAGPTHHRPPSTMRRSRPNQAIGSPLPSEGRGAGGVRSSRPAQGETRMTSTIVMRRPASAEDATLFAVARGLALGSEPQQGCTALRIFRGYRDPTTLLWVADWQSEGLYDAQRVRAEPECRIRRELRGIAPLLVFQSRPFLRCDGPCPRRRHLRPRSCRARRRGSNPRIVVRRRRSAACGTQLCSLVRLLRRQ